MERDSRSCTYNNTWKMRMSSCTSLVAFDLPSCPRTKGTPVKFAFGSVALTAAKVKWYGSVAVISWATQNTPVVNKKNQRAAKTIAYDQTPQTRCFRGFRTNRCRPVISALSRWGGPSGQYWTLYGFTYRPFKSTMMSVRLSQIGNAIRDFQGMAECRCFSLSLTSDVRWTKHLPKIRY